MGGLGIELFACRTPRGYSSRPIGGEGEDIKSKGRDMGSLPSRTYGMGLRKWNRPSLRSTSLPLLFPYVLFIDAFSRPPAGLDPSFEGKRNSCGVSLSAPASLRNGTTIRWGKRGLPGYGTNQRSPFKIAR